MESLRKKLHACVRDNQNLQEELSEVYRIKSQLADLHSAEVSKNMQAEKQIKFFQGCVASAFAERDSSIMEAEKAKEQEEAVSEKLCNCENRLQELQSAYLNEKKTNTILQTELEKLKAQHESFEKVILKFYEVRETATGFSECKPLEAKCSTLLDDPVEMWIFDSDGRHAPSSYIDSLEEQLATLRESMDSLQRKMQVGMEIEQHLQKKVRYLEKKQTSAGNLLRHCLSTLREFHTQQRSAIMNILEDENREIKSVLAKVQEKMRVLCRDVELTSHASIREDEHGITDHRQEDITNDAESNVMAKDEVSTTPSTSMDREFDTSDALARALKEKVEALLLLSQQEERHMLERDLHIAVQKKMEDLQRNLAQVANEKVKALLDLAQLKKEYQLLQVNSKHGIKHADCAADDGDKVIVPQERNAKLKNLLKKTYLRRWVGRDSESEGGINTDTESSSANKNVNCSMDLARLKVENATLQESIANISHLTSSIHKLRLSLLKVINDSGSTASDERVTRALHDIFHEVDHLKTALSSSLPVSWSAAAEEMPCQRNSDDPSLHLGTSTNEKLDPIVVAGFEMVRLLVLAAELVRENLNRGISSSPS